MLDERGPNRDQRLAELRAAVQVGLDQLDRGQGKPWDKDEVWSEVQRRLNERQMKR
ncbi:MAG: hypothetical protein WD894_02550 [Pirellulales bacterium]